jgi:hypothetical protein
MWNLVLSEFAYFKRIWVPFFCIAPFVGLYSIHPLLEDLSPVYILAQMMFLATLYWMIYRNREKRDRYVMRLPLSLAKLGAVRLLTIAMGIAIHVLLYIPFPLFAGKPLSFSGFLIALGFIVSLFSIYFIFRDTLFLFLRRIGLTSNRVLVIAVFLGLGLNILGMRIALQAKTTGKVPVFVDAIANFLIRDNPFTGEFGLLKFLLCSALLTFLSILAFKRRRSYVE